MGTECPGPLSLIMISPKVTSASSTAVSACQAYIAFYVRDSATMLENRRNLVTPVIESWLNMSSTDGELYGAGEMLAVPVGWMDAHLRLSDPGDFTPDSVCCQHGLLRGDTQALHSWVPFPAHAWGGDMPITRYDRIVLLEEHMCITCGTCID